MVLIGQNNLKLKILLKVDRVDYKLTTILLIFLVSFIAGGRYFMLNIGNWLSTSEKLQNVEIIVCLSHDKSRVQKTVDIFRKGYGKIILVTTALTYNSLRKIGLTENNLLLLDLNPSSTFQEALYVSAFLDKSSYQSAIIVSDPIHLYRARWSFNHLLPETVTKRVFISSDPQWAEDAWWKNTATRKYVFNEISKVIYYWVVHGLFGREDNLKWALKIQYWYQFFLNKCA